MSQPASAGRTTTTITQTFHTKNTKTTVQVQLLPRDSDTWHNGLEKRHTRGSTGPTAGCPASGRAQQDRPLDLLLLRAITLLLLLQDIWPPHCQSILDGYIRVPARLLCLDEAGDGRYPQRAKSRDCIFGDTGQGAAGSQEGMTCEHHRHQGSTHRLALGHWVTLVCVSVIF